MKKIILASKSIDRKEILERSKIPFEVLLIDVDEDGVVKVKLQGACAGCPMSQMTLKMGIEKILKQNIPEVARVESV